MGGPATAPPSRRSFGGLYGVIYGFIWGTRRALGVGLKASDFGFREVVAFRAYDAGFTIQIG